MSAIRSVLALAICGLACVAAPAHAAGPLLGQWSLDGAYEDGPTGGTADGSGNGLDLKAPAGTIRIGKPGKYGSAALLPANGSVLRVDSPVLAPARVTLLAWVKQSGAAPLLRYIAGRGDDGPGTCLGSSYALYTGYPGFGGLHFYVRTATTPGPSSVITPVIPDAAWTDGQWHLLAGTFDGSKARLYIDGNLVSTSVESATAPIQYALGGGTTFYLDGYPQAPCGNGDFPGGIDEVRVYDRALSASELARLAAATGPAAPLLITDESLIPAPVTPVTPVTTTPAAGSGALRRPEVVQPQELDKLGNSLTGASKRPPPATIEQAANQRKDDGLGAMRRAEGRSQVSEPQVVEESVSGPYKRIKPEPKVQERLGSMRYGVAAELPATKAGQVVEAVATVVLEKKQGGKVTTQTIVLPPSVDVVEASQKKQQAELHFPVDGQATAAMTKNDVAKAAISTQALVIDSVSELGETQALKLQQAMDRRSKALETLSNVLDKMNDAQQQITQNLKGGVSSSERKEQKELTGKLAKLDKEAKKIEAQRDAANKQAAEATQAAAGALVSGAAGAIPGGLLPTATTMLSGCSVCKLAAAASN